LSGRHAVYDVRDARPTDRVTAQHARFDRRIERAATKIERIEMLASLAYGFHFGVRGGVKCRPGALDAFSHYDVSADDQRAHGCVAGERRGLRQFQAPPHVHCCAHMAMVARRHEIDGGAHMAVMPSTTS